MQKMKMLRTAIVIVVGLFAVAVLSAGFLYYDFRTTSRSCGEHARSGAERAASPDFIGAVLYEACMRDQGYGGWG